VFFTAGFELDPFTSYTKVVAPLFAAKSTFTLFSTKAKKVKVAKEESRKQVHHGWNSFVTG